MKAWQKIRVLAVLSGVVIPIKASLTNSSAADSILWRNRGRRKL